MKSWKIALCVSINSHLLLVTTCTHAFQLQPRSASSVSRASVLNLVPANLFRSDLKSFFDVPKCRGCLDEKGELTQNDSTYQLCLVEDSDLPDLSRFIVKSFGADAIRLSQDISSFERILMKPAVELLNGYSGIIAFAEVLAGLRHRLSSRLKTKMDMSPPQLEGLSRAEKISLASQSSLVLVLAKQRPGSDWGVDVIASVELRLEPCDAKIPFSLPWLDRMERGLASLVGRRKNEAPDLQPYLSNLCVDEEFRGQGIGQALVCCVERITHETWGFSRLYLHVDVENEPALNLYMNGGYRDVGLRWKFFWTGKAADIGYFVKGLK